MSSTTGAQNLLVNVFRPAYTYNSNTGLFTPTVDLTNVAYSGNTLGAFTIAVGDSAGNVYVGSNAGNAYNDTRGCTNNVALGYSAGELISNVANSIYLGSNAGANASNASNVIAIGNSVGGSGTSNIFVGSTTGSTGSNNILIGHGINAGASNNLLRIGSTIYGNLSNRWIGIGTDTPLDADTRLDVSGDAHVSGILSAGAFDISSGAISSSNLVVSGYLRNSLVPTQFDISGGNISNSATITTSNVRATNGTVSAPTYSFVSDASLGVYRVGANQLGFASAGLQRMTISNANVGVGTTAPSYLLDVSGTTQTSNALVPGYVRTSLPTDTFMVAAGSGTNTIAYSADGTTWTGLGTSIFSTAGRGVAWNGSLWLAAGNGTNTLAYSTDGINWTGLGTSIFSTAGGEFDWNGSRWVAVGSGTNSIAYSSDGINWTGLGSSIFSPAGQAVAWNGSLWVAVGQGTNTIAYSTDGINWTGLGTSIFSSIGYGIAWNGSLWVAVGNGTNSMAYSRDGINWTGLGGSSPFSTTGFGVGWNGSQWVAVGQGTNSIAYSSDGITWTGVGTSIFSTWGFGVAWNGSQWVAGGGGTNTLATSSNGISWTGLGTSIFSTQARNLASRRYVLPVIDSTLFDVSGGNIEYTGAILGSNAGTINRIGGVTLSNYNVIAPGRIGIGTTAPATTLDVSGMCRILKDGSSALGSYGFRNAGVFPETLILQHSGNYNNTADLGKSASIYFGNAVTNYPQARIVSEMTSVTPANFSANLIFQTISTTSVNFAERMRIHSNGNVGIGTSTPSYTFDMSGIGRIRSATSNSYTSNNFIVQNDFLGGQNTTGSDYLAGNILLAGGTATPGGFGDFYGVRVGAVIPSGQFQDAVRLGLFTPQAGNNNTSAERLTILSGAYGGRVGIGITNPTVLLDVCGDVIVGGSATSNLLRFRGTTGDANSNFTVLAERIYGGTEQSELVLFKGNDPTAPAGPDRIRLRAAEHRFQTYTGNEDWSGLADNNDRMTITSGGNVGIARTDPSHALDVNGTIRGSSNIVAVATASNWVGSNTSITDTSLTIMYTPKQSGTVTLLVEGSVEASFGSGTGIDVIYVYLRNNATELAAVGTGWDNNTCIGRGTPMSGGKMATTTVTGQTPINMRIARTSGDDAVTVRNGYLRIMELSTT